jgi:hypothetical protein
MAAAETRAVRGCHRTSPATAITGGTGSRSLRIITAPPALPGQRDRAQAWLRSAMVALAVLAAAAAAVSCDAQYEMVGSVKHAPVIAALEAGIPDVGALIFASLGIALALHGRRALRARTLNLACVATSLAMNALRSAPGWRDLEGGLPDGLATHTETGLPARPSPPPPRAVG